MSRLVDPALCPDCRTTLGAAGHCPGCGLVLRGPLAAELWTALVRADDLVERLRAPGAALAPMPAAPAPVRTGLPGRTVPALLLTLGGLLVLVAVSLFLAVTWSVLPLSAKTLVMAALTAAVVGAAYAVSARGLRGSAEALWAVAGGVLVLDLSAAWRTDLAGLDALSFRSMGVVVGIALAALGLGAAALVRPTRVMRVVSAEVLVLLGLLGVATAGLDTPRLHGWPLLLAALLLAVVTGLRVLGDEARTIAAGAALVSASAFVLLPPDGGTVELLLASAVLAALGGVALLGVERWSPGARLLAAVGGVTGVALLLLVTLVAIGQTATSESLDPGDTSPWALYAVLAACLVAARSVRPTTSRAIGLVPVLAVGLLGTVLSALDRPVGAVAAAYAFAAALALVPRLSSGPLSVGFAGGFAAAALVAALPSALTGALVATALLVVVVLVCAAGRETVAPGGALVLGYAAWRWAEVAQVSERTEAVAVVAAGCATLLAAAYVTRRPEARVPLEAAGALVGLLATMVDGDGQTAALVLTLLGSSLALVSVLRRDRELLCWVATGVLAVATGVRFVADVRLPEAYALPAAAVLIVAGVHRLRQDHDVSTWRVLGAGTTLALTPSLLLALGDPGSLRTVLVGVGAAATVAAGLQRRWQAPFLVGGSVLTVLALRFLLPLAADVVANPLGAWIFFGSAGAALLLTGVLWEQSLRNLRTASRYVGSLR